MKAAALFPIPPFVCPFLKGILWVICDAETKTLRGQSEHLGASRGAGRGVDMRRRLARWLVGPSPAPTRRTARLSEASLSLSHREE